MSKLKDVSPKVEITIRLEFEDCEYPEPTRETIRNKLREILSTNFAYSEKRYPLSEPFDVHNDIVTGKYEEEPINPYTARFEEQRNIGTENVASSKYSAYALDTDPLNEE